MAKKLSYIDAELKEVEGKIEVSVYDDNELLYSETLNDKIKDFEGGRVKLTIAPITQRKSPVRQPKYKYVCKKCNTELVSKAEGLRVECKECGELFEPKED